MKVQVNKLLIDRLKSLVKDEAFGRTKAAIMVGIAPASLDAVLAGEQELSNPQTLRAANLCNLDVAKVPARYEIVDRLKK